jgi:GT2 family glycosyltransferase
MYTPYLAIASMFRDSQMWHGHAINQVPRYFEQLSNQTVTGDIFCLEGNSEDNTAEELNKYKSDSVFVYHKDNAAGTTVKSTADKHRIINLSTIANHLLDIIYKKNKYDYIFWLESDIIIRDNLLIEKLFDCFSENRQCGMVAPKVFLETKNIFYDTWGFNGTNKKIVQKIEGFKYDQRYFVMDSVGTCALMCCKNWDFGYEGFRTLSSQVKQANYNVYADVTCKVYHPSSFGNVKNRWI